MRKRFEECNLKYIPIPLVTIPMNRRDEKPGILKALQWIYTTPKVNSQIYELLESDLNKDKPMKQKLGRSGMSLWQVLVLGILRNGLNADYDKLQGYANDDELVRGIMGISNSGFVKEKIQFAFSTIKENVKWLDKDTLEKINKILVSNHPNNKKKKKCLKTDSFVLETNIHFPNDLWLLYDAVRKLMDYVEHIGSYTMNLSGFRKIKYLRKKHKKLHRLASEQVFKGRNDNAKRAAVQKYLTSAQEIDTKSQAWLGLNLVTITQIVRSQTQESKRLSRLLEEFNKFLSYSSKLKDQVERRILKGEVIPAEEKLFSTFEDHTEWISKGKMSPSVQLGHAVLITTDENHLIVDYKVTYKEKDVHQMGDLLKRLEDNYKDWTIESISFDRGFYSAENIERLKKSKIKKGILPKKGRYTEADRKREKGEDFKKLRNQHSAVESNIHCLQNHGLIKCRDKGKAGFERCVGLGVLAYNLHQIGNLIMAQEKEQLQLSNKVA